MKDQECNLDSILSKLRNETPDLSDSSLLTEQIMRKIKEASVPKTPKIIYWVRYTSTIASVVLFFVLMFEQNKDYLHESKNSNLFFMNSQRINRNNSLDEIRSDYNCKSLYSEYLCKVQTRKNIQSKYYNLYNDENDQ